MYTLYPVTSEYYYSFILFHLSNKHLWAVMILALHHLNIYKTSDKVLSHSIVIKMSSDSDLPWRILTGVRMFCSMPSISPVPGRVDATTGPAKYVDSSFV